MHVRKGDTVIVIAGNDRGKVGEIKSVHLTMGEYDLVILCEASDDAVMARFVMQLGMLGFVRTRTLKAFPETAYREIIASLR